MVVQFGFWSFNVACGRSRRFVILSRWFVVIQGVLLSFKVVCGRLRWFVVIQVVLCLFKVICGKSRWFVVVQVGLWSSKVVCGRSSSLWPLTVVCGCSNCCSVGQWGL